MVSGRHLPAALGVLSWIQEIFLMGVFFKWVSTSFWRNFVYKWIAVFKKKAQIYFTEKKKKRRNLTATAECPSHLWGLRGTGTLFGLGACSWAEVSDRWLDYMIYKVSSNSDDSLKFWWPSSDHWNVCLVFILLHLNWKLKHHRNL